MSKTRKKPKLDFGAMVADSQTVNSQARLTQEKHKAFVAACNVSDHLLSRTFSLCDQETAEMMIVSTLGLEGVDLLRTAMQLVPESYVERRPLLVRDIVNTVLQQNGKVPLNETQCNAMIGLLKLKCNKFLNRKAHPNAYDEELLDLTNRQHTGYNAFLGPPTTKCFNVKCHGKSLSLYNTPTNVTIFTLNGPRPGSKVILKCSHCNTNYGYSKYGNKLTSGERFYENHRQFIEASDVVFVDQDLHQLFTSLRYVTLLWVTVGLNCMTVVYVGWDGHNYNVYLSTPNCIHTACTAG